MASLSPSTSYGDSNNYGSYDVFINHYGPDVSKTLAGHLYHRLSGHGLRVFKSSQIDEIDEEAIRTASVDIAIFSPRYAESRSCLEELAQMLKKYSESGPICIIPVFYNVTPAEVGGTSESHGQCSEAMCNHEHRCNRSHGQYSQAMINQLEEGACDSNTIEKWREALSSVRNINGFTLEDCNQDEGKLVNRIVERVLKKLKNDYQVFISHRGPDAKKTLASHLYYSLVARGLRVFLDIEELRQGDNLTGQINRAIKTAFVHITIFSPCFAGSTWCLNELVFMLETGSTIIPVFYHMKPSEFRSKYAKALCGLKEKKTFDSQEPRFDNDTLRKWRNSLSYVAERYGFDLKKSDSDKGQEIKGFDLEECDDDEGELVDKVVQQVLLEEVKPKPSPNTPPDLRINRNLEPDIDLIL